MKTKRSSSPRGRRTAAVRVALPLGMRKTRVVSKSRVRRPRPSNVFTPMETGRPGPLNQEGEGERQNDDLAALEGIEPDL
jgi:hypothetical protein